MITTTAFVSVLSVGQKGDRATKCRNYKSDRQWQPATNDGQRRQRERKHEGNLAGTKQMKILSMLTPSHRIVQ